MAFRGISDDATKVAQEQERIRAQKAMQANALAAQGHHQAQQMLHQEKMQETAIAAQDKARQESRADAAEDRDYRRAEESRRFNLTHADAAEDRAYNRERQAGLDSMAQSEHDLKMRQRQMEVDRYQQAWDIEQQQFKERQEQEREILGTGLAGMYRTALKTGGVVPISALEVMNANIGAKEGQPGSFVAGYFNDAGQFILETVTNQQDENGNFLVKANPMSWREQYELEYWMAGGKNNPNANREVMNKLSGVAKQFERNAQAKSDWDKFVRQVKLEEAKAEAQAAARAQSGTTRGGGARGGGGGDDMGAQLKRAQDIRAWMSEIQKRIDDGTATDSDLSLMENLKNTEYHLSQVASRTAQGMTQEDPEAEVMRQVEQKSGLISQYNTAAEQFEELKAEALKMKEAAEKDMKSDIGLSYSEKIGKIKALSATMNDIVAKMNKDRMPAPSTFTDLTREELNSPSVAGAHDRESPFPKTAVKNAIGGISHIQAQRGSDESGVQIIVDDVKNNKQVAIPVVDIKEPDPSNKDAHRRWENYMKLRMLIGDKEIDYVVAETQRAIMEADAVIAKRAAEGYLEKVGRKQAASRARKEEEKSGTMRKVSARGGL